MSAPPALEQYVRQALEQAVFGTLDDGSTVGRVPPLPGVIAFGASREECARALSSVALEWARLHLRAGGALPTL